MIAFKFLARGAVGPFTGFAWPTPSASSPGAWVEVPPASFPRRGIHACLVEHLPYWLDEELWEAELDGIVQHAPMQVITSRGRLLRRVASWTKEVSAELAQACLFKARDTAADFLKRNRGGKDADELIACADIAQLERVARTMSATGKTNFLANLIGYVADAAKRAKMNHVGTVCYVAADLARAASGSPEAAISERIWQGRWIAARLQLPQTESARLV